MALDKKRGLAAFMAICCLLSLMVGPAVGAATNTWDGGGSGGNWTLIANWDPAPGGVAPIAGNVLRFPAGVARLLTTNNFAAGMDFGGLFLSDNYVLRGNSIDLSNILSADLASAPVVALDIGLLNNATINVSAPTVLSMTRGLSLNGHLAVFDVAGAASVSGAISGTGTNSSLVKIGSGSLRLSGTNSLQGPVTVSNGTLTVNGFVQSNVVVAATGLLSGTGRVARASIAGGLHPGDVIPGVLSVTGSCTFAASATFTVDINGPAVGSGYSQLRCSGPAALGSAALIVKRAPAYTPAAGATFVIISNTTVFATSGTFAGLTNNAVLLVDGIRYQISYTGGSGNDVILKVLAAPVVVRGPYLQTGTTNSVIVAWRTTVALQGVVRFGTSPAALTRVATETTSAANHFVQVSNLAPNTKYFYSIGDVNGPAAGGDSNHYFITSPAAPKPVRAWVIGDSGTATSVQLAVRDAYKSFTGTNRTDIWLMLGDNAYDSGTDDQYQAAMFDVYPEMLRNTVVWSAIGNHETYNGLPTFPYFDIFNLPTAGEAGGMASGTEKYYSFDYANIHFVCLDAMTSDRSSNGPMCQWLRSDLANHTKDWLIAFWHHPPYTKGTHDSDNFAVDPELVQMRENAVPILEAYGVDLVLCGHSHVYERSYLLHGHYGYSTNFLPSMKVDAGDGRENGTGPYTKALSGPGANLGAVYVVAGNAGHSLPGPLDHPAMYYSVSEPGSVVLDIDGQRLDARFLRDTGVVEDYFTILKSGGPGSLEVLILSRADGRRELRWNSQNGAKYQVQETLSIEAPSWAASGPLMTATNSLTTWVTPSPETSLKKFYRIMKSP
jgi:autotransporter-associated beta strand protein